jgi:hypothetical protein
MRRGAAHLTIVLGDPTKADELRSALDRHGVDHAAVVTHPWSIRRSLVLGENEFVVVCIAIDRPTLREHGEALRTLLSDHRCFPTTVRTVGLLSDLGLTREAAELGCDVYVEDSAQAAEAIRLLDDAWSSEGRDDDSIHRLKVRGGWMHGTPDLPIEVMTLVSSPGDGRRLTELDPFSTHPRGSAGEDLGDPGPP